jgi:ATP-binding cassette subfamily B protein
MSYSRPYVGLILVMLLMILFSTGLSLLTPLILRDLIDNTIPTGDLRRLAGSAILLLLIPNIRGVFVVIQRWMNARVGEGVIYDLRVAVYSHLQRMSLRFFTNSRVGELMSRLNNDVVGAQNAISNTIVNLVTNVIQGVALLLVMFNLDWRLTLISVAILPLFILIARRMGRRLRDIAREGMDLNAQMNAMMNETLNIGGALLVKLFGRRDAEVASFQTRAVRVRDIGIERAVIGSLFFVTIGLVGAVGTALVYGVGGYMAIEGSITIGTIVAFAAYLASLYTALQGLANAPVEFSTSVVSFERVFEVIDLPLDIEDKNDAVSLHNVRGELEFEDVTFAYEVFDGSTLSEVQRFGQMDRVTEVHSGDGQGEGKTRQDGEDERFPTDDRNLPQEIPGLREYVDDNEGAMGSTASQARDVALSNISFRVQPGQLVALVGASGAGKTTLTYLIPRLYDPTEGRILIDGHDLLDLKLDSVSDQIGMVTQETYLFHDTIRTNLLYANPHAKQEEIEEAARAANIHDFIMDLPEKYETIVGERGYRLSGGEKQRIALARVILKNPRILVLDEATSHLDSESEALIQEALKRVMAERTSIVIAHRLSTILAADQILVIDRGKIVERGSHDELIARGGTYAQLYRTQFNRVGNN